MFERCTGICREAKRAKEPKSTKELWGVGAVKRTEREVPHSRSRCRLSHFNDLDLGGGDTSTETASRTEATCASGGGIEVLEKGVD